MQKFVKVFFTALFVVALSGCGNGATNPNAAASNAAAKPAAVRLGYFANVTHAQALLGVARGDFQKALGDIPLKTSVFNAGPSVVEALFAGELDLAYIGPGPAVSAFIKSHGQAVRVASGAAANGVVIVARKDSGIKTLADLKGKKIVTPQYGNTQDIAARIFVKATLKDKTTKEGGTTDLQTIVNAEQIGLFKQGQIDAAWAPEPWGTRLIHEAGATLIEEEKNLWPEKRFAITLLLVHKKFLDAHPELVEALLKTNADLTDFINTKPAEAAAQLNAEIKKLLGKPLAPEILTEALSRVEFTTDPLESSVVKNAEWSFDLGFSKEKSDLKGLFDLTILQKIRAGKAPPK